MTFYGYRIKADSMVGFHLTFSPWQAMTQRCFYTSEEKIEPFQKKYR